MREARAPAPGHALQLGHDDVLVVARVADDGPPLDIEEDSMGGAIRQAGPLMKGLHLGETNRSPPGLERMLGTEIDVPPLSGFTDPPLITVHHLGILQGRLAAEKLIALLRHERVEERATSVDTELVIRRSCGAPGR